MIDASPKDVKTLNISLLILKTNDLISREFVCVFSILIIIKCFLSVEGCVFYFSLLVAIFDLYFLFLFYKSHLGIC